MSLKGKLANRTQVKKRSYLKVVCCEKCSKIIDEPKDITITTNGVTLYCKSYIGSDNCVYEGEHSGRAICYCSEYCARKHNHRFRDRK